VTVIVFGFVLLAQTSRRGGLAKSKAPIPPSSEWPMCGPCVGSRPSRSAYKCTAAVGSGITASGLSKQCKTVRKAILSTDR